MKLIYLAGPIDKMNREEILTSRRRAKEILGMQGFTVYDPATSVLGGFGQDDVLGRGKPDPRVAQIHREALRRCDGMLALLPEGVPTIGTPMEIEQMRAVWKKPVVIVGGQASWHLAGYEDLWLFDDESEAIHCLKAQMDVRAAIEADMDRVRNATEPMPVQITGGQLPTRAHPGDAGFDLYVSEDGIIAPGGVWDVPCGIRVELPEFIWGFLVGRSSVVRKRQLQVQPAIIDQGYRGEIFAYTWNIGQTTAYLKKGERIAQLIPIPQLAEGLVPMEVEELSESSRGTAGFGSSGQ